MFECECLCVDCECVCVCDLGKSCSSKENGDSITPRVSLNLFQHLYSVIGQEVVELEPANVTKGTVGVIPLTEETKNMSVVVQELLKCVELLVGSEWLHRFQLL